MTVGERHCTSCGAEVSLGANFCRGCGKPVKIRAEAVDGVEIAAICPYCNSTLESFPKGKKMCPMCKKPILVRTTPLDKRRKLVTEAQAEEIDAEKAILRELKELDTPARRQFEAARTASIEKTGGVGRKALLRELRNTKWQMYNRELLECGQSGLWGAYRNVRFNMGEQLRIEGRHMDAVKTYLEVCYLDMNGEPDFNGVWNTQLSFIAPGVVERIQKLIAKLALTREDVKTIFLENLRIHDSFKMPKSVSACP